MVNPIPKSGMNEIENYNKISLMNFWRFYNWYSHTERNNDDTKL